MNIISITPLLNLIGIDTGQETAVGAPSATRPTLPMWRPQSGDTAGIERVINRVRVDGNVTVYEQEVIFINEPAPEPERPYAFETYTGAPPELTPAETAQVVADWHAGRAHWVGGPPDPNRALAYALSSPQPARIKSGRIVLQE
jgi:hypothetical protein